MYARNMRRSYWLPPLRIVEFAHQFRAKVYVTVNTLIYENELKKVERLISDLYKAGVDALIVQDLGVLRLDIPYWLPPLRMSVMRV